MSYSGERIYRLCIWCDRPFHVWRFELKERNRGKFCSHRCYTASRRAFSDALADGRLEGILAPEANEQRPSGSHCCGKRIGYEDGTEISNCLESLSRLTGGYCGWLAQPSEAVVAERHN